MAKTITTRYGAAEPLRIPEEMAAYLEACFEKDASYAAPSCAIKGFQGGPHGIS
jgi:hypothetical protein